MDTHFIMLLFLVFVGLVSTGLSIAWGGAPSLYQVPWRVGTVRTQLDEG